MPYGRKICIALCLSVTSVFASEDAKSSCGLCSVIKKSYAVAQAGYYWSHQGSNQHINIEGLIGDQFTVTSHSDSNYFVGLGYFLKAYQKKLFGFDCGVNAFYLSKTSVNGNVIQENAFTNLSYRYNVTHYPIYATLRSLVNITDPRYAVVFDVGMGPNFMHVGDFKETSLDQVTLPDQIFSDRTVATFSAMLGLGMKFDRVFGPISLELGYRFFYLGEGSFKKSSSQVQNSLDTSSCYGNALIFSIGF